MYKAKLGKFYLQWRRRYRVYRYWGIFFSTLYMYQLVCCTCSKVSPVKCAENNNYSETRPAPSRIKRTTSRAEGLIRFQITPDYSWWCCCCCGRVFLDLVV